MLGFTRTLGAVAGPSRSICRYCLDGRSFATAAAVAQPDPQQEQSKLRQRHEEFQARARQEEWERYRFPKGRSPGPYEVLQLGREASGPQVKERYYQLARMYHPDSSHPDASPANFLTLNKAYKLLSSPQSRQTFLRTGYGWGSTDSSSPLFNPHAEADAAMRSEIHFRRRGMHPRAANAHWAGGFRGDGGFDPYDGMDNHGLGPNPSRAWEGRGGPEGKGEERYMTNGRFLSWVGALSVVFAWIQYHRLGQAASETRMALDRQHLGASHALAEARHEAALYGRERRERIRRKLREKEVDREYERLEGLHGRMN